MSSNSQFTASLSVLHVIIVIQIETIINSSLKNKKGSAYSRLQGLLSELHLKNENVSFWKWVFNISETYSSLTKNSHRNSDLEFDLFSHAWHKLLLNKALLCHELYVLYSLLVRQNSFSCLQSVLYFHICIFQINSFIKKVLKFWLQRTFHFSLEWY